MVTSGAGITLLPSIAVAVENRRSQLETRPFRPPVPRRTIALVWRKSSPRRDLFRDFARALVPHAAVDETRAGRKASRR
jgi:LysR family hydrogen peroxide-inducible transcriptional activator